jgi:hypothetical protein
MPPLPSITSRTIIGFSAAGLLALCGAIATGTWRVAEYMNEQAAATRETQRTLESIRAELRSYRNDAWNYVDMTAWAKDLRWENREINLSVPEPKHVARPLIPKD